jgi:hypothetical protein
MFSHFFVTHRKITHSQILTIFAKDSQGKERTASDGASGVLGALMAEEGLFFYGVLVMFVLSCMTRNHKQGRPHVRQLVIAAWALFSISVAAATYFSLAALHTALQA